MQLNCNATSTRREMARDEKRATSLAIREVGSPDERIGATVYGHVQTFVAYRVEFRARNQERELGRNRRA